MTKELSSTISDILYSLSSQMGISIDLLWKSINNQMIIDAYFKLFSPIYLLIIILVFFLRKFQNGLKKLAAHKDEIAPHEFEKDLIYSLIEKDLVCQTGIFTCYFLLAIFSGLIVDNIYNAIKMLLNPEFYALQFILEAIK